MMNKDSLHTVGILFDIDAVLDLQKDKSSSIYNEMRSILMVAARKVVPRRIKTLLKKTIMKETPYHFAPFYFEGIWPFFFDLVRMSGISDCEIYAGETWATLGGRENDFCIQLIGRKKEINQIQNIIKSIDHPFFVSQKRRFLGGQKLTEEPLMKIGRIDKEKLVHLHLSLNKTAPADNMEGIGRFTS